MKNLILCATTMALLSANASPEKPNIIFIYADDMGWTGSSVEMIQGRPETKSDYYQTPNLEKLAAHGMVFSQAYSPGSMCTPSRASVLTGKTPAELHITTPGGGKTDPSKKWLTPQPATRLPDDIPTIGSLLKAEGYATALLGKWHIGRNDHAGLYGFDRHDGSTANANNGTESDPKEIISLTDRGIRFMEDCVQSNQPFYLQLSHYAVHSPTQSHPESIERFESIFPGEIHWSPNFGGMTWDLDKSLGSMFDALEQLKITDRTYVVFMSDNGAGGNRRNPNNTPLFAGKGTLYEGGIRVPLIISGPGIKTGYCAEAVSGTDLISTFSAWAKTSESLPESEDLTPLLCGSPETFSRSNALLFHSPHYGQGPMQVPQTALISGPWKLLKDWENETCMLFNLNDDLGETNNLASKEPLRFTEMTEALELRLKQVGAQLPSNNPDYAATSTQTSKR